MLIIYCQNYAPINILAADPVFPHPTMAGEPSVFSSPIFDVCGVEVGRKFLGFDFPYYCEMP